jgi:hypothetical protein
MTARGEFAADPCQSLAAQPRLDARPDRVRGQQAAQGVLEAQKTHRVQFGGPGNAGQEWGQPPGRATHRGHGVPACAVRRRTRAGTP